MPSPRQCVATLCATLLGALLPALHAGAERERWYLVELIVFTQPGGAGAEHWEPLPALNYPEQSRFLIDRDFIARALNENRGNAALDPFGRLVIKLPPEPGSGTMREPVDKPEEPAADQAPPVEEFEKAPRPTPFVTLGNQYKEFRGKAAYMEARGGYRMLFHESWAQPVAEESAELPIVLDRSGDNQQWGQLQGSVKLHLSRYLHLQTDLWLNTGGEYLPGSWRMPEPPLAPPSIIIEEPPVLKEILPAAGSMSSAGSASPMGPDDAELDEAAGPVYPWRHAVRLQQKRRMRSNEVHYIDHPMLGVIIQLIPLDDEALAQLAQEEIEAGELPGRVAPAKSLVTSAENLVTSAENLVAPAKAGVQRPSTPGS